MLSFLIKPYPFNSKQKSLWSALLISCFVSFFLIAFQPWGIGSWVHPHKTAILLGYGAVCFITTIVCYAIINLIFNEDDWKVWKEIISELLLIIIIGLSNFIYSDLLEIVDSNTRMMTIFIAITFLLGIFPVAASIFIKYNGYLRISQQNAQIINTQISQIHTRGNIIEDKLSDFTITFTADNGKDNISVSITSLLYIQSADNYSVIVHIENQQIKKTLIRSNLKRLEAQHNIPHLIRCHRSNLVNLTKVKHIEGNAQGYKISFSDCADTIRVSRSYGATIIGKLASAIA